MVGFRSLPLLLPLSLLGACDAAAPPSPGPAPQSVHPAPLARIAVIGASLASGFRNGAGEEDVPFGAVLDSMLLMPHETPLDLGTAMFFLDPEGYGSREVEQALRWRPSLVVALDFPFWYVYGSGFEDEEARLSHLERGLAELDRFHCPLVVGDLPDMRAAIGTMLSRNQVPHPETLERASARIREWVRQRARRAPTTLFSLVERAARRPSGPAPGGQAWLQPDHLHPTLGGSIALGSELLRKLEAAYGPFPPDTMETDPEQSWEMLRD